MKQQFLIDQTGTIRITAYNKNRALIPTSAYITLYKPSGETLQARTAATVNNTTGEMTYSLTATHTDNNDLNYKAVWEYVVSGVTYFQNQLFDVVKSILAISIIDEDLYNELESIKKTNIQLTGTATSATTSTLVDTANRKEADDYWKGGEIEIISGTGIGQSRPITTFVQSTSTVSVSPNWVTTPDTTSVYRIVRSYYYKIEDSFEEIEQMLYNKGKRHELIIESSQITFPLLYLTLHKICLDLMDNIDDKWDRLAKIYNEKFLNSFQGLALEYDSDESGFINEEEKQSSPAIFRFSRE